MKCRWPGLVSLALCLGHVACAAAGEQYLPFLDGLRNKGYHEYALFYLSQIETDPDLPPDVRSVLPLERALTLLEHSRDTRNPDARKAQLQQSEGLLDQFVRNNANHPRAAEANAERARIHLEDARIAIIEARSPSNDSRRNTLRAQARDSVRKAREIFQKAHAQYESQWKEFPVFIPEEDKPRRRAREEAETKYYRVQYDLAQCTYEEAQTYAESDPNYKRLLTEAANQFEAIHSKYRLQIVGLFARLWQGKCFQEQGELGKALGIFNSLIDNPGSNLTLISLKNQARYFRLLCWNDEKREDQQLVVDDATAWLNDSENRTAARTRVGTAIRYERARAVETLTKRRTLPQDERERMLRQALSDAQQVAGAPYEYKDLAIFMSQRLKAALGRGAQDPQDFDTAVGLARSIMKEIEDLDLKISQAENGEQRTKLQEDRKVQIGEAARLLQLALRLADARTELAQVNRARMQLAYMYYLSGESRRAAVLGEFLGRRFGKDDPTLAQDSAFLAMVAWIQAANAQAADDRDFETEQIVRLGELITKSWPESERAIEARMQLGKVFDRRGMPAQAAGYYDQIPASAASYPEAQVSAGQAYWNAYLKSSALPEGERPDQEELRRWQEAAQQHLKTGIEKTAIPSDQPAPDEYIAAKLTLAQIKINQGQEAEAIKLINDEPHSVIKAIEVPEGRKRPGRGVKSVDFASLTYQLLLRSYVGTQQIDEALAAMGQLERIVPAGQDEAVTAIYVRLGQELAKEIERLRELGETERMAQVFRAFDRFLGELFNRKDNMGYGALRWIAETYYGLGESLGDKDPRSDEYFRKSGETYQILIDRAGRDKNFAPGTDLSTFKLRLAETRKQQGNYEGALTLIREVVAQQPNALDAQMAAAGTLQAWGESRQPGAERYLLEAINGQPLPGQAKIRIWGWAQIASRLQAISIQGNNRYSQQYYQAVYNQVDSRKQYATAQSDSDDRMQTLRAARMELEAFARLTDVQAMGNEWWDRFDRLYRDIQREMGILTPVALEKPLSLPAAPPPTATPVVAANANGRTAAQTTGAGTEAASSSSGGTLWAVLAILVALAAAGGLIFVMLNSQNKQRRKLYAAATEAAPSFTEARRTNEQASSARTKSAGTAAATAARPRPKKTQQPE